MVPLSGLTYLAVALNDASPPITARSGGMLTPATELSTWACVGSPVVRIHCKSEVVCGDGENRKDL